MGQFRIDLLAIAGSGSGVAICSGGVAKGYAFRAYSGSDFEISKPSKTCNNHPIKASGCTVPRMEPGVRGRSKDNVWSRAVGLPKVLIVDDDNESRQLLSEVLEGNGYAVGAVADGPAAREALRQDGGYRIVIADLHMPKETGLQLFKHLREQHSTHDLILMSSFISVSERQLAQELGARALLEKPFRLSELLQVVGELAQNNPIGLVR